MKSERGKEKGERRKEKGERRKEKGERKMVKDQMEKPYLFLKYLWTCFRFSGVPISAQNPESSLYV